MIKFIKDLKMEDYTGLFRGAQPEGSRRAREEGALTKPGVRSEISSYYAAGFKGGGRGHEPSNRSGRQTMEKPGNQILPATLLKKYSLSDILILPQ